MSSRAWRGWREGKVQELLAQLGEVDRQLADYARKVAEGEGRSPSDYSINRLGSEPVAEDHMIDAHEHHEAVAARQAGPEALHLRRQELVDGIDRLRLVQ